MNKVVDREYYKKVGHRVRELRVARKWMLGELAEELKLHPSAIHRMETGKQGISLLQAEQLAGKLGVDIYALIGGDDDE